MLAVVISDFWCVFVLYLIVVNLLELTVGGVLVLLNEIPQATSSDS